MKTNRTRILFVMGRLGVNGATKSLLALLAALPKDCFDISLFVCLHDTKGCLSALPVSVKLLPPVLEYEIHRLPLRHAVSEAFKHRRWDMILFRLRIALARMMNRGVYPCWDTLPAIKGDWDFAISYADGWLSSMVINKVTAGKKLLWLHINPVLDPLPEESLGAMKKADGIIGVSKDCVENLERLVGEDKLPKRFVVHNIVDEKKLKRLAACEKVSLPGDGYKILTVGRLTKEKGHIMIPSILKKLMDKGICADWSIVGAGLTAVKDGVIAKAQELGIADHIHFLGAKENPYSYYVAADCYAQTSFAEGWCMTISEALALGVPVVCNDLPVFHEQVIDGVNGFCAKDEDSFADALARVLKSEANLRMDGDSPCHTHRVIQEFNEVVASYL